MNRFGRMRLPLFVLGLLLPLVLLAAQIGSAETVAQPAGATLAADLDALVFEDVAADVGLVLSHDIDPSICPDPLVAPPITNGAAWGDYDNDGDVDLYVTNHSGPNRLYRNDGDTDSNGMPNVVDQAVALGIDLTDEVSMGTTFIDYDNDGDQDLFVANWGGNKLFKNMLSETDVVSFMDVSAASGLVDDGRAITAGWADFDQDGFLDVYLAKHTYCMNGDEREQDKLFKNNGDGSFSDVTGWLCPGGVAPCDQVMGAGFSGGWLDYDNDGDQDLYLVNDILDGSWYHNVLWRNDGPDGMGGWIFTDVSTAAGVDRAVNGMGLGIGDYDNDGFLDLAFSNIGVNTLYQNNGDGTFTDVAVAAGVDRPTTPEGDTATTWGTAFVDVNADGWKDLLIVGGWVMTGPIPQPNAMFRNQGDGTFLEDSSANNMDDAGRGRNAALADFDDNGFMDVFIGNFGEPPLLMHNPGNTNNWLKVTVEGTESNRDGIGTRLYLEVGGRTLIHDITSGATHGGGDQRVGYFGMRQFATGHLTVRWPSGVLQDVGDVDANQRIHLVEPVTTYVDVAGSVGLVLDHGIPDLCPPSGMPPIGSGSAWADYDNDGDIDLYVTNMDGANRLYRNEGDTNLDELPDYTEVALSLGVGLALENSTGAVFADYDNDGDQDLYVGNWGGNTLFENQLIETGSVSFVDVTATAGVAAEGRTITAAWADYNQDSYLDLYITKHKECMDFDNQQDHLYHNNGDGTFTDVTGLLCPGGVAPCDQVLGLGFSPGWVDYDNDGDQDLYLVNDNIDGVYQANILWRNDGTDGMGGWMFTDVSASSGADFSLNGMGLGVGDYNNDGWFDFAFSNIAPGKLLMSDGDGTFTDVSDAAGVTAALDGTTWGTAFFDYDNDGWLDLFYVAGNIGDAAAVPDVFMRNNGDGTFTNYSTQSGLNDPGRGRSASIADIDADGFPDVFVGNYGQAPKLFYNKGNDHNWLSITVEGTESNRDGIGTRIWVTTPDGTMMREINTGPTHGGGDQRVALFGLGMHTSADVMVRWPNGIEEDLGSLSSNQMLHLVEPAAGLPEGLYYVSPNHSGSVGGINYEATDVLVYDNATDTWNMVLDGSSVGLTVNVDAFHRLPDGRYLLSFSEPTSVPGLAGTVDDSDIVRYDPMLNDFVFAFDGSDMGLTTSDEDIDGIDVSTDGRLLFSLVGSYSIPGPISGGGEDILKFEHTRFGRITQGSWQMFIDGSAIVGTPLTSNIEAVAAHCNGTDFYLRLDDYMGNGVGIYHYNLASNTLMASPLESSLGGLDVNFIDGLGLQATGCSN